MANPLLDISEDAPVSLFDGLPENSTLPAGVALTDEADMVAPPPASSSQTDSGDPFTSYRDTVDKIAEIDRIYNSERKALAALPNKYLRAQRMQQLEAGYQEARGEGVSRIRTYEQQVRSGGHLKDAAELGAFDAGGFEGVLKYRATAAAKTLVDERKQDQKAPKDLTILGKSIEQRRLALPTLTGDAYTAEADRIQKLQDEFDSLAGIAKTEPEKNKPAYLRAMEAQDYDLEAVRNAKQDIQRFSRLLDNNKNSQIAVAGRGLVPRKELEESLGKAKALKEGFDANLPVLNDSEARDFFKDPSTKGDVIRIKIEGLPGTYRAESTGGGKPKILDALPQAKTDQPAGEDPVAALSADNPFLAEVKSEQETKMPDIPPSRLNDNELRFANRDLQKLEEEYSRLDEYLSNPRKNLGKGSAAVEGAFSKRDLAAAWEKAKSRKEDVAKAISATKDHIASLMSSTSASQ